MAVTEIRHILLDAAEQPRGRVHARARLLTIPGFLDDLAEITAPYETYSHPTTGLLSLFLTPSSEVESAGALYEVTYLGLRWTFTVPDGGPFDLFDVLVPSLGGTLQRNLFDRALISTSFEDSTVLGWAGYANTSALASVVGNAGHGFRSMRVTSNGTGGTCGVQTSGFHPVTSGASYSFSFYAVTSLSFQAFAYWYDSGGTLVQGYGAGLGSPPGNAGRIIWAGHVAPAGATQVKWDVEGVSVPASASYYVDAIQYEQAATASAYEV